MVVNEERVVVVVVVNEERVVVVVNRERKRGGRPKNGWLRGLIFLIFFFSKNSIYLCSG